MLFSVLTLAVIATLTALVIAPKETRQFFAKLAQCVDSWVQAMVKMVSDGGELVKDLMRQNKAENKKNDFGQLSLYSQNIRKSRRLVLQAKVCRFLR